MLPVEVTCYASEEEITRAIQPLIAQYFPAEAQTPYKVQFMLFIMHLMCRVVCDSGLIYHTSSTNEGVTIVIVLDKCVTGVRIVLVLLCLTGLPCVSITVTLSV